VCELCGSMHVGGMAQCVYNPQSPAYNTAFGEERRARAFSGATGSSSLKQSVFRRVNTSARGGASIGMSRGGGKGGASSSKN
jgi:hypothetical protein